MNCKDCKYFHTAILEGTTDQVSHHECRKHAPLSFNAVSSFYTYTARWPSVNKNDWCGEFQPRDTETKQA